MTVDPRIGLHPGEMTCQEFVELVTDYFEGALSPEQTARFEDHLAICDACPQYVDQLRTTIRLTGRLTEEDVTPASRAALLMHFRTWSRSHP